MASASVNIRVNHGASYAALMRIADDVQNLAKLIPEKYARERAGLLKRVSTAMTDCVEAVSAESGERIG